MGTITRNRVGSPNLSAGFDFATAADIAVTTAMAEVGIITLSEARACSFTVTNTGSAILSGFQMSFRTNAGAEWVTRLASATDFTSANPALPVKDASLSPVSLGAGSSVQIRIEHQGYEAMKIEALGSAATTLSISGYMF